jgi:hypothetical protein
MSHMIERGYPACGFTEDRGFGAPQFRVQRNRIESSRRVLGSEFSLFSKCPRGDRSIRLILEQAEIFAVVQ